MSGVFDVGILGGGVIGMMSALELARAGQRVAILDRNRLGAACSHGNCGYVCPSHVLPLTRPGVLRENGFKVLSPRSALYIKPRLSPALMGWMLRFARRCNERDMLAAADALHPILESSRALYDELFASTGIACDFEAGGLQYVYETPTAHAAFGETAAMLHERYGLVARRIGRDELIDSERALRPEAVAGAWVFPRDAHLRPDLLMAGLRRELERLGVAIIEGFEATKASQNEGTLLSLRAGEREVVADRWVIATGAMTPLLARLLGRSLKVPIQPGKGYSYTTDRPEHCPRLPMIFEERHVAVTPWQSGFRVGSTMEFAGYDARMNPTRLANLRRASEFYLRPSPQLPTLESWFGWRPMTPDSLPMIGLMPGLDNATLAAGHNMLGLSLATGTGRLVRELVLGQAPHLDPSPYDPARFS